MYPNTIYVKTCGGVYVCVWGCGGDVQAIPGKDVRRKTTKWDVCGVASGFEHTNTMKIRKHVFVCGCWWICGLDLSFRVTFFVCTNLRLSSDFSGL